MSDFNSTNNRYIASTSMEAVRHTMSLVSTVLGFDILELWAKSNEEAVRCVYIHVTGSITEAYPDIITGYHPDHRIQHKLSPLVSLFFRLHQSRMSSFLSLHSLAVFPPFTSYPSSFLSSV